MAPASEFQIVCSTPGCGLRYRVTPDLIGKLIRCKGCGKRIRLTSPAARPAIRSAATADETAAKSAAVADEMPPTNQVQCPHCRRLCGVRAEWGGKKLECPSCHSQFVVSTQEFVSPRSGHAVDQTPAFSAEDPAELSGSAADEGSTDEGPVTSSVGRPGFFRGLVTSMVGKRRPLRTMRQHSRPLGVSILGWLNIVQSIVCLIAAVGLLIVALAFVREYAVIVLVGFVPAILALLLGLWLAQCWLDGRVWCLRLYQIILSPLFLFLGFVLPAMLWQLGFASLCVLVVLGPVVWFYFYHFTPRVESWFTGRSIRYESYVRSRYFVLPVCVFMGPFCLGALVLPFGLFDGAFTDSTSEPGLAHIARDPQPDQHVARAVNDPAPAVTIQANGVPDHVENLIADPSVKPKLKDRAELTAAARGGETRPGEGDGSDIDRTRLGESPGGLSKGNSKRERARKTPLAEWTAKPDPTDVTFEVKPPKPRDAIIPVPKGFWGSGGYYPSSYSPFVVVGGRDQKTLLELWNASTRKGVARIVGDFKIEGSLDVSPDGMHVAFVAGFAGRGPVEIWSFKTGQKVHEIAREHDHIGLVAFAGPDRLVVASGRSFGTIEGKTITLWDRTAGEVIREILIHEDAQGASVSISPGGKYLVLSYKSPTTVRVYDLTDGSIAGELDVPKHDNGWDNECKGLRISNDGSMLAGLFEAFGKHTIFVWDFASGQPRYEHTYKQRLDDVAENRLYHGPPLDWFPDNSGWLVFGNAVLDRASGEILFKFPDDKHKKWQRRLLDNDHFAAFVGVGQREDPAVQVVALPKEQIAEVRKSLPAVTPSRPVALPPETNGDWSVVKQVSAAAMAVRWAVALEPTNTMAQRARKIDLKTKRDRINRVQFSSADVAQVAVDCEPGEAPGSEKSIKTVKHGHAIERYDVRNGNFLGRSEIPDETELFAFCHDATRVLLRDTDRRERLDVWSIADAQSIAGWLPYATEHGEDRLVTWAAFVDATKVLTNNKAGKLVLWSVPGCEAIWAIERASLYPPILSPRRKYVIALGMKSIQFLDTTTGEARGELTTPSLHTGHGAPWLAATIRNDGEELAAIFWGRRGNNVSRWLGHWNLTTGKLVADFPVPGGTNHRLDWCGESHALLDGRTLVDLQHKRPIWHYAIRWGGQFADASADRRVWYTAGIPTIEPDNLSAVLLPEPEVTRRVRAATRPDARILFGPKSSISLSLAYADPPRDANQYRKSMRDALTASLQKHEISVAQNQPVTLSVDVREQGTGDTIELEEAFTPGFMNRERLSIQVTDLIGKLSLKSVDKTMWDVEVTFAMRHVFGFLHLPEGETDPGRHLRMEQWNHFQRWIREYPLPEQVSQLPDGTFVVLPGFTELTPDGVAEQANE